MLILEVLVSLCFSPFSHYFFATLSDIKAFLTLIFFVFAFVFHVIVALFYSLLFFIEILSMMHLYDRVLMYLQHTLRKNT